MRHVLSLFLLCALVSGCLWEPGVEDSWTKLDILAAEDFIEYTPGQTEVAFRGTVTWRSIITGHIIVEIRRSERVTYNRVHLGRDLPRDDVLTDVNKILQDSTPLGYTTVPVTGWDHLIREVDLLIPTAALPAEAEGLFLVFYLGDVETEEAVDGSEIEIITPFDFEEEQILPAALPVMVATPAEETQ